MLWLLFGEIKIVKNKFKISQAAKIKMIQVVIQLKINPITQATLIVPTLSKIKKNIPVIVIVVEAIKKIQNIKIIILIEKKKKIQILV